MNRRLMLIIILMAVLSTGLYFYPRFFSPQPAAEPQLAVDQGSSRTNPFGTVKDEREEEAPAAEGEGRGGEEDTPRETYRDSFRDPFADYRLEEADREAAAAAAAAGERIQAPEEPEQTVEKPAQPDRETGLDKPAPVEIKKIVMTPERARAEADFELIGIIGNDYNRRAIIRQEDGQVLIVNERERIKDYQVVGISNEEVVFKYQGVSFNLGMGGGHD